MDYLFQVIDVDICLARKFRDMHSNLNHLLQYVGQPLLSDVVGMRILIKPIAAQIEQQQIDGSRHRTLQINLLKIPLNVPSASNNSQQSDANTYDDKEKSRERVVPINQLTNKSANIELYGIPVILPAQTQCVIVQVCGAVNLNNVFLHYATMYYKYLCNISVEI